MRRLRDSEVTPAMTEWAVGLQNSGFLHNLGAEAERSFPEMRVVAKVETHTNGTAMNPSPHPHPGISLFALDPDEGHAVQAHPIYAEGVDVSGYQTNVDWKAIKAAGKSFVWIKATGGSPTKAFVQDPMFVRHWHDAGEAGLLRGAYHYFSPAANAIEQAKCFRETLSRVTAAELPPVLDLEEANHLEGDRVANGAAAWLDYVDSEWVHPILYTMPGFFNTLPDVGLANLSSLWVAHWTAAPAPLACKGFKTWHFWQYTASGVVPGYPGKADLNRFNGTDEELRAFLGIIT